MNLLNGLAVSERELEAGELEQPGVRDWVLCLVRCYRHWTGRDLISGIAEESALVRAVHEAPFVVMSHGDEPDPVLKYGNRAALRLWEMSWDEFTRTPSRFTAEAPIRTERQRFLEEVARKGFIDDYSGVRISRSGRRFRIEAAVVWTLMDDAGRRCGQAATFERWTPL